MSRIATVRTLPQESRVDRSYPIPHKPLQLRPIAWGRKDQALARQVINSIRQATPPITIPVQPGMAKIRATLDTLKTLHL